MKQKSYNFKVLVPELINIIIMQLIKASSTRHSNMCLMSTHSLMVRRAGQMSVPFYRQETQHLSLDNKKKRAGNSFPAPTNVTGCLCRRVLQSLDLPMSVIKSQQLTREYLPSQMRVSQKTKENKEHCFLFLMTLFYFSVLIKTTFSLLLLSPPFISVRHLSASSQLYNLHIFLFVGLPNKNGSPMKAGTFVHSMTSVYILDA